MLGIGVSVLSAALLLSIARLIPKSLFLAAASVQEYFPPAHFDAPVGAGETPSCFVFIVRCTTCFASLIGAVFASFTTCCIVCLVVTLAAFSATCLTTFLSGTVLGLLP